jgi:hypothetical protein
MGRREEKGRAERVLKIVAAVVGIAAAGARVIQELSKVPWHW